MVSEPGLLFHQNPACCPRFEGDAVPAQAWLVKRDAIGRAFLLRQVLQAVGIAWQVTHGLPHRCEGIPLQILNLSG